MNISVFAIRFSLMATAVTVFSACYPVSRPGPQVPPPQAAQNSVVPTMYEWHDDGGPGKVKVRINLTSQKAYFTRGGRPIGWTYVTTGKEGYATPGGTFPITEKIVDKHSGSYGWTEDAYGNIVNGDASAGDRVPPGQKYVPAPMPYWMRLTSSGIGMHAGVIPKPGETASHGCIRLPKDLVPRLYRVVEIGTPVEIVR